MSVKRVATAATRAVQARKKATGSPRRASAAAKAPAKKAPAAKAAAKRAPAAKAPSKKAPAASKRAAGTRQSTKPAPAKTARPTKTTAKHVTAKKAATPNAGVNKTAKAAPANKTAKAAPARKTTKAAPARKTTQAAPARKTTQAAPARKTSAVKAPAAKASTAGSVAKKPSTQARADVARPRAAPATTVERAEKLPSGRLGGGARRLVPAKGTAASARRAKATPRIEDPKFLDEQRASLMRERETYIGQAEDLKAEAVSMTEEMEPGDIQFDDESGEGGTFAVDRERDLALSAQALAAVEEIDAALAKIAAGTYGLCESCQTLIPRARLKALPYARLCINCKSGGLSRR